MNFAKSLRILIYRTPPDDCFWIFFIHLFFATQWTNRNHAFLFLKMFYHGFRTWRMSWSLHSGNFARQTTQLLLQGNTHFSMRHHELSAVFGLINLLTFICTYLLNFYTPLSCIFSLKSHRSSCRCDSLIQGCSLKKLFLNISQYQPVFLIIFLRPLGLQLY